MNREETKAKFMRGATEMFEEMWDWGEEHPKASFDEITGKLSQERRALMGEMLGGDVVAAWRWEVRGGRMTGMRAEDELEKDAPYRTTCVTPYSISTTIVGVCAITCSVRQAIPSAVAPSNPPANMSSGSASSNLECSGPA